MSNEFDDPELERMLGRLSGAYPDANVAFEAVRGRVRQVRRRRAFVASTAACAVLFGVAAVAAQGGGSSDQLSPADRDDTSVTVSAPDTSAPVTTDMAGTPADSTPVTDDSTPATMDTTADTTVDTSGQSNSGQGNSGQGDNGQGGGSGSSNSGPGSTNAGPSTSDHTSSSGPTTSATLPQGEKAWASEGGSVTVRNDNGRLTLVSVAANTGAGFHEDRGARDVQSDRIRIEFTNGNGTWRIEVRTDNGKSVAEISHQG